MKRMILMVVLVAITLTAKATDIVTLKGNKNRVLMLERVLSNRALFENRDAIFRTIITKGAVIPGSSKNTWTEVEINGSYFGRVQISNNMYNKVMDACFVETSEVQAHLIINYFCNQQNKFLRSVINSLSRKMVNPNPNPQPQVEPQVRVIYRDRVDTVYVNIATIKEVPAEEDLCMKVTSQWQNVQAMYDAKQITRSQAKEQFNYLKSNYPDCVSGYKMHFRDVGVKTGLFLLGAAAGVGISKLVDKKHSSKKENVTYQKPRGTSTERVPTYQKPRGAGRSMGRSFGTR